MFTIYLICFLVGGTLIVCQVLLSLLGMGHLMDMAGHEVHLDAHDLNADHDSGHDTFATWFASVLTFRTLTAALTFFGLGGLAAYRQWGDENWPTALAVAVAAAVGAFLLVGFLMRSLLDLRAEGTVRIEHAVGQNGTVYLTIPGQKAGVGKVLVPVQNRTMEYQAMTPNSELPTGAKVVVVAIVNSDTVEVLPATDSGV